MLDELEESNLLCAFTLTLFHTFFILISSAGCQRDGEKPLIRVLKNAIPASLQSAQPVEERYREEMKGVV